MPELTGVLTADEVIETAATILRDQTDDGLILWFPGGHADAWNHVEAAMALDVCGFGEQALRAYEWLKVNQHTDGWWHNYYLADGVEDPKIDTNVCAYVATGVWHHWLLTGDRSFLEEYWGVVARAIDFVLSLQKPRGEIIWARHTDGTPWSFALLTGSSSILHSLRCAIAIAEELGRDRPDWELSAARLAQVITHMPDDAFEPKHRWAMDWYYPVLAGPLVDSAGRERLAADRQRFVIRGLGVRCVSDKPWITAAETSECAMAYARLGMLDEAAELVSWAVNLRCDDGAVLTGAVYPEKATFPPDECSTYTAAALVLAVDAIGRTSAASGIFVDEADLPELMDLAAVDEPADEP